MYKKNTPTFWRPPCSLHRRSSRLPLLPTEPLPLCQPWGGSILPWYASWRSGAVGLTDVGGTIVTANQIRVPVSHHGALCEEISADTRHKSEAGPTEYLQTSSWREELCTQGQRNACSNPSPAAGQIAASCQSRELVEQDEQHGSRGEQGLGLRRGAHRDSFASLGHP